MTLDSRFEEALSTDDRVGALRRLAQNLLDHGHGPDGVLMEFEQVRRQLRDAAREDEEDAIVDVMDFLSGWCSPHMRLVTNDAAESPVLLSKSSHPNTVESPPNSSTFASPADRTRS